jgi:glycosyltransferase involved in cell wall biosynthesis
MQMDKPEEQATALKAPTFLVFSDDWGGHPSSCQHLFRHIGRNHRVAWINTIGMRNPSLRRGDLRKAFRKVSRMIARERPSSTTAVKAVPLLDAYQPFMLPGVHNSVIRAFNANAVDRTLRLALRRIGQARPVVVTTVPNTADYLSLFEDWAVVYYCVDDFSLWDGHNARMIREMEERLIARATALIATSQLQYERLSATGKPAHLLTHGVDLELFGSSAAEHGCVKAIPHPRIGFFGLIDQRLDQQLLRSVARVMPEASFVLAGPVEVSVRTLEALDNVHFCGRVHYEELPALIGGLDVLMLPYKAGELGDTLSPLKLKECLATGKPIISAPIAATLGMQSLVTIAHTSAEWRDAISASLAVDVEERRRSVLQMIRGESWAGKAAWLTALAAKLSNSGTGCGES